MDNGTEDLSRLADQLRSGVLRFGADRVALQANEAAHRLLGTRIERSATQLHLDDVDIGRSCRRPSPEEVVVTAARQGSSFLVALPVATASSTRS